MQKNGVTSTVTLTLQEYFFLRYQRGKLDYSDGSKKSYIWKDVMKAVTFYFENLEPTACLYRFGLAFLPFTVDLTFGKILNI